MTRQHGALGLTVAIAFMLGGCGGQAAIHVPRLTGMKVRDAESQLFHHHLRWRVAPGTQVFSRPLPAGEYSSADEFRVTGQHPAAGARTKANAVVVIVTPCTATKPCS